MGHAENTAEFLEILYKRLVGPYDGINEYRGEEPHGFYTTGILDTINKPEEIEETEDEEILSDFTEGETVVNEETEEEQRLPTADKPFLDPKSFPVSMGILFVFERNSDEEFESELFLSYAEYRKEDGKWIRIPYSWKLNLTVNTDNTVTVSVNNKSKRFNGDIEFELPGEVFLRIKLLPSRTRGKDRLVISLINKRDKNRNLSKSERCIYQPQIGIRSIKGKVIYEGLHSRSETPFKGMMCSVITAKEIENLYKIRGNLEFIAPDLVNKYGEETLKSLDLLTTFLPFYIQPAPEHNESYDFSVDPSQSDEELITKFLREVRKLVSDYADWIDEIAGETEERQIAVLRKTIERMNESLNLLSKDEKVRQAFAFALKTAAKAAQWNGITNFSLRPFQAAYVLLVLHSLCTDKGKDYCDILNVHTGAGKTEAYLILAVFYAAYRRLIHGHKGGGTAVISRYTLRMLTVQQFLRTLRTFTAAEFLRKTQYGNTLGEEPFSVGLWVGQGITPNKLNTTWYNGKKIPGMGEYLQNGTGENIAGIVSVCPSCGTPLVISRDFMKDTRNGKIYIPFKIKTGTNISSVLNEIRNLLQVIIDDELPGILSAEVGLYPKKSNEGFIKISILQNENFDLAEKLADIWEKVKDNIPENIEFNLPHNSSDFGIKYPSFRYPGYRLLKERSRIVGYEIFCPNPECELNQNDINIHGYIVDEYLYKHPPTFLLGTVDKFAQLPCKDEILNFFGGAEFLPPGLIIQDEIHLIEGPMGSLFGLYECAVDYLCNGNAKYISSSATVKEAATVSLNALGREAFIFPQTVKREDSFDNFFIKYPLRVTPGKKYKIYAGICAFGKSSVTPQVDTYEALLKYIDAANLDIPVVGYYNEIKELARAVSALKQDVSGRVGKPLILTELSSRIRSERIAFVLREIERNYKKYDVILSTSIFGTGVDIPNLQLMVMRGQPKRTADYIQATGRVGRKNNAFVFVIYGNTRPRDISHFEYFVPYHAAITEYIEDPSVYPFATSILERVLPAIGTVVVKKVSDPKKLQKELCNLLFQRNQRQKTGFRMHPGKLRGRCMSTVQRLQRCKDEGYRAGCLYSLKQKGKFLLTSLSDDVEGIREKACFTDIPSSLRNTDGEIYLEID